MLLYFRSIIPIIPTVENVPISVRKISDHQFSTLSLIDKNKTNWLVKY